MTESTADTAPAQAPIAEGPDWRLLSPVPEAFRERAGRYAARKRLSLEKIVGKIPVREDLLWTPIRADRMCIAVIGDEVVGYLSYRMDGQGALCPVFSRYRARFGLASGAIRYLMTQATLYRNRRDDLLIEGYAVEKIARGRGIGRALLDWLSAEVVRNGKAGWRTEMPAANENADRMYRKYGAVLLREIWLGPAAYFTHASRVKLYRWTPPRS